MTIPALLNVLKVDTPTESGYSCLAAIIGVSVDAVAAADVAGGANGSVLAELALKHGVYMRTVTQSHHLDRGFVYLVGRTEHPGTSKMNFVILDLREEQDNIIDPQMMGFGDWLKDRDSIDFCSFGDQILVIRCLEIKDPVRAAVA